MMKKALSNGGPEVSRLGYGCADLVPWHRSGPAPADLEHAARLVETAVACGITLFDLADVYAFGHAERAFGEVLRRSPGLRERIVVQTKCGQVLGEDWQPGRPVGVDLRGRHILASAEASLARLGVEAIDILLLHAPSPLAEPDEIAAAFDALHAAGKVSHFGVSNFAPTQIALLARNLNQPILVNQVRLGLGFAKPMLGGYGFTAGLAAGTSDDGFDRATSGASTVDWCRLNDIQVQAWSPLRGALLKPNAAAGALAPLPERLGRIADALGTSPAAVSLAWLLRHPAGIVPILGTTDPDHLRANVAAQELALDDESWLALFAAAATG